MAEAFLAGAAGLVVIAAVGMFGGLIGKGARIVTGLGSLALIVVAAKVGHSGGELVYRYGAAAATPMIQRPRGLPTRSSAGDDATKHEEHR